MPPATPGPGRSSASGPDGRISSQPQNWLPIHSRWPVRSLSIHQMLKRKSSFPTQDSADTMLHNTGGAPALADFGVASASFPKSKRVGAAVFNQCIWRSPDLYPLHISLKSSRVEMTVCTGTHTAGLRPRNTSDRTSFIITTFPSTWRESIILLKKTRTFHRLGSTTDLHHGESYLLDLAPSREGVPRK